MSESSVETLEKTLVPRLIWTGGLTSLDIPQKSRRTLMALQEYEITRGSPNQHKIKPYFPALAPEQFPVPHQTRQVA